MPNMSNYYALNLGKYIFQGVAFTVPATYYFALFTAPPLDDGTGGTEVTGNGYARVAVIKNTTNFAVSTVGTITNAVVITFPTDITANWGTIVAVGIYDAATVGNLLMWENLPTTRLITVGDTYQIPIGFLSLTKA